MLSSYTECVWVEKVVRMGRVRKVGRMENVGKPTIGSSQNFM